VVVLFADELDEFADRAGCLPKRPRVFFEGPLLVHSAVLPSAVSSLARGTALSTRIRDRHGSGDTRIFNPLFSSQGSAIT
jgi:hypothetical protein